MNEDLKIKLHHNQTVFPYDFISNNLWYFISKQSYLQRNSSFDNSFLCSNRSNIYVATVLKHFLSLDIIHLLNKEQECDSLVNSISNQDMSRLLIFVGNNKSLFTEFY